MRLVAAEELPLRARRAIRIPRGAEPERVGERVLLPLGGTDELTRARGRCGRRGVLVRIVGLLAGVPLRRAVGVNPADRALVVLAPALRPCEARGVGAVLHDRRRVHVVERVAVRVRQRFAVGVALGHEVGQVDVAHEVVLEAHAVPELVPEHLLPVGVDDVLRPLGLRLPRAVDALLRVLLHDRLERERARNVHVEVLVHDHLVELQLLVRVGRVSHRVREVHGGLDAEVVPGPAVRVLVRRAPALMLAVSCWNCVSP